jgi:hypothetical protein
MKLFDPSDADQIRFDGYGLSTLPNGRDDEVTAFVEQLRVDGPTAVAAVRRRITDAARDVLQAYAERMASLAVRRGDRAVLLNGVIANVVGGLDENLRESLMVMALIDDSAARLGVDLAKLFEEASKTVDHPGMINLVIWLTRDEADRSLASMGFVASEDPDGFLYKFTA